MTPDQINIAIEEATGIKGPFVSDLNACAMFEEWLKKKFWHTSVNNLWRNYCVRLASEVGGETLNGTFWDAMTVVNATSIQKCTAFLKTIGEWVE